MACRIETQTLLTSSHSQTVVEKTDVDKINWKRNAVFVAFGGFYLGGCQWFIYVTCFRKLFPAMDVFANQVATLMSCPSRVACSWFRC